MKYIGMDVHIRNSYLHITDENGQVFDQGRCGNTFLELREYLEDLEGESVRVCLESTTNSRAVRQLVLRCGQDVGADVTVDVLHARKLRIIAESVTKCDRLDAQVINELARSNFKLPVCYMPDDEEFALREHLRARSDLVGIRTMLKNRIHAVLHRRGILTPAKLDLFTRAGRLFLDQADLDEAGRTILTRYLSEMDHIDASIEESTQSLKELARRPRWSKPAALLQTMPGIGLITALTILAELGDLRRFHRRAAVANYAGLVPVIRQSDEAGYSGGITRRGSNHLRRVLTEAAWVAVGRVPSYAALFDRVSRRRGRQRAIIGVARQMLEDAWTILRKDEAFRYVDPPGTEEPAGESRCDSKEVASSVAG